MSHVHPLVPAPVRLVGAKAQGLATMLGLGLPVPPGVVVDTAACREFLGSGRLPTGLLAELTAAVPDGPLSVRSGAAVSMPGMMSTILDVDRAHLESAVEAVFSSWNTPRARTYRALHDIPHGLGTAAVVQAMVFGDRDPHSGTGVAFSRDPNTGAPTPYGEVLFGHRGTDVVSGSHLTSPLAALDREPGVWHDLRSALATLEGHYRDVCSVEFTFESGKLWLLQARAGGLVGTAAVRAAVDLAREGRIDRTRAVLRVDPRDLAEVPRIADPTPLLGRGTGAVPGVAVGRVATTADRAARTTGPVILVRPETSPLDLHGMAASVGIVTARGGPTSHAAVVARAAGTPAVVGVRDLVVHEGEARFGSTVVRDGTVIAVDGGGGLVVEGRPDITTSPSTHMRTLLAWADEISGTTFPSAPERLATAHSALRTT
ncbi:PEP/pyruvate-binding domain-containing protein [Saccharothrix violaceirubra]|uniref:Phosphoenolpyruvate synthase/pyruvate phosphate dikinase n=1 Tax=Saccharothrix violaceirubra TaxID=413306 RepID=A0A7W7T6T5_9PSEU|nr:PEP/pyruvate-binding domain-containing protein [Saccharothrix violaceirubra]MBB4967391.1 phosphoenolpyruvate synthase/pyruvate phosphate dikinase [Saccharothrix violaceirubra]